MARLLVMDVKKRILYEKECNGLDDYYEALDCEIFDIARRKIGDAYFDIYCDDCGLYDDNPIISALNHDGEPMLVGNLIFANSDSNGETVSLSDKDIELIRENIVGYYIKEGPAIPAVLCEY